MRKKFKDQKGNKYEEDLLRVFLGLTDLISTLRGPGGCPWDAQQTMETVKVYILEEAYEVLDAIEKGDPEHLCQELGDLIFQVLFLTSIAEDKKEFDLLRVIEGITKKMIHRHPHVFGSAKVNSAKEVAENWEKIKKQERGVEASSPRLLTDVPPGLPALLRAHRLSERASRLRAKAKDGDAGFVEGKKAFDSLKHSLRGKDKERIGEDLGNCLFHLADLARNRGLNAESLLRKANERFLDRFRE